MLLWLRRVVLQSCFFLNLELCRILSLDVSENASFQVPFGNSLELFFSPNYQPKLPKLIGHYEINSKNIIKKSLLLRVLMKESHEILRSDSGYQQL